MFASIALIKTFLTNAVGIIVVVIVLASISFGVFEHHETTVANKQIAALNQQLGSVKANDAQWQATADACSKATAAVVASEVQASAAASQAVATAEVKTQPYVNHAKTVLSQKPAPNDDYAASKQLMNGLIDFRQQQLSQGVRQ
jgi:predicted lipid-binding transport protein (Tim44 family)